MIVIDWIIKCGPESTVRARNLISNYIEIQDIFDIGSLWTYPASLQKDCVITPRTKWRDADGVSRRVLHYMN